MRHAWLGCMVLMGTLACGKNPDAGSPTPSPTPTAASPTASAGADRSVLAGMTIPLDASASTGADIYSWEQSAGDSLALSGADQARASVQLPASAVAGTDYTFRVTVTDSNTGNEDTDSVTVSVVDPQFESFLAAITDPNQLGTTEGIAVDAAGLWVASTEGFVSHFDAEGSFIERFDVPNTTVGINFIAPHELVVARATDQAVYQLDTTSGNLTPVTTGITGGGALGPVNYPLPDKDGNIYFTNRTGGTVFRYDAGTGETQVFVSGIGTNPNALCFGPEPDMLYVGTVGQVQRIPILSDGTAGTPELYVDNAGGEVDGLAFDAGGNLWIGPADHTLRVAPYSASGPTTITRVIDQPAPGYDLFINPTFGSGVLGDTTFYYTNLGDKTVGRVDIGLPAMELPLAP